MVDQYEQGEIRRKAQSFARNQFPSPKPGRGNRVQRRTYKGKETKASKEKRLQQEQIRRQRKVAEEKRFGELQEELYREKKQSNEKMREIKGWMQARYQATQAKKAAQAKT